MKLPLGFGRIDWGDWMRGVLAAFISGGAGAVTSAFTMTQIDPDHFKMGGTKFFEVAGVVFAVTGFLNMMAFLRQKPIPDMKKVVTTVQTTSTPGPQPDTRVVTVQETKTVPMDAAVEPPTGVTK